ECSVPMWLSRRHPRPPLSPYTTLFRSRVRKLKAGDPNDPETLIGPIINDKQLDGLRDRIAEARSSGAREIVGGEPQGAVLPPHRSEEHTSELQSRENLVCRLLLEKTNE